MKESKTLNVKLTESELCYITSALLEMYKKYDYRIEKESSNEVDLIINSLHKHKYSKLIDKFYAKIAEFKN